MRRLLIFIAVLSAFSASAQDYHFSQFYANKMMLNPALTGRFNEDYRLSLIHRNQWRGIDASFNSTSVGGEINLREGILKDDKVGIGIYAYNDQLGEKVIVNNSVYLSTAYHHFLDHSRRHNLSGGAQFGYTNKKLDGSSLTFGNQYQSFSYNPSLSHNEDLTKLNNGYIDIQAGLAYSFLLSDKWNLSTGVSLYDITTPRESSIDSLDNELSSRYVWHAGASYKLNSTITLYPKILYVTQAKAHDLNFGLNMGYDLHTKTPLVIYVGAWIRPQDAVIGLIGAKIKNNLEIKFSHDFTTSSLRQVNDVEGFKHSGRPSAYEISITYTGLLNRATPHEYTVPCGIF